MQEAHIKTEEQPQAEQDNRSVDREKSIETFADSYVTAMKLINHRAYEVFVGTNLDMSVPRIYRQVNEELNPRDLVYLGSTSSRILSRTYNLLRNNGATGKDVITKSRLELDTVIGERINLLVEKTVFDDLKRNVTESIKVLVSELGSDRVLVGPTSLSIITEDITLDYEGEYETHLGKFEVAIDLGFVRTGQVPFAAIRGVKPEYRVFDMSDRKYASASDNNVTHPHVRGSFLCEGDYVCSISTALQSGDLAMWWDIVSGILYTYTAGEAFVDLAVWDGVLNSCYRCHYESYDEEYFYTCWQCDESVCDECVNWLLDHDSNPYCKNCYYEALERYEEEEEEDERTMCYVCEGYFHVDSGLCTHYIELCPACHNKYVSKGVEPATCSTCLLPYIAIEDMAKHDNED